MVPCFFGWLLFLAPSVPLISVTPQTTTISLNWIQPPGDVVDFYNIAYTSTTEECRGTIHFMLINSISGINGSLRSYTLKNLEEDSEYNITVEAVKGAGKAGTTLPTTRTSVSGMLEA